MNQTIRVQFLQFHGYRFHLSFTPNQRKGIALANFHANDNYLNSSHIILETRIYEIDLYSFEERLNNPYSFLL